MSADGTTWLLEQGSFARKVGVSIKIIGNEFSDAMNCETGCLNLRWPASNLNTQMQSKSLLMKYYKSIICGLFVRGTYLIAVYELGPKRELPKAELVFSGSK